jgi:tetratricopeptide (TPR) repeat protein
MSVAADPLKLDKAIAEVLRYSLMQRNMKEKMLSLHRLVQVVVQAEMNQKMQRQWAERAMRAVNHTLPQIQPATLPRGQRLLPHAQICATLIRQYGFVSPEAAQLLMWTGSYLVFQTEYQQEELLFQRALAIQEEQMQGLTRPTTIKVVSLGPPFLVQERNKEAEPRYKQALAIREQVFGPEHLTTANPLSSLGWLYREEGKYKEAELHFQRALAICEQAPEPDDPLRADILHEAGLGFVQKSIRGV